MSAEAGDGSGGWRTFGERVIFESPEVWLGQVDVGLPSRERIWRPVVRVGRTASAAVLDESGRVLLVWRHRFVQERWGWELPGGLVDEGEDPAGAAARELEDQAGYRARRLEHLVTFQAAPDVGEAERVVFCGRDAELASRPVTSEPMERAEWVSLDAVPGLIRRGELWYGASMLALLFLRSGS